MRVLELSLADFRNYRSIQLSFRAGANLILGLNGQGKTNLLEAIGFFATLGSHRIASNSALIRAGCDAAIARMQVAVEAREVLLEVQLNRIGSNRAQVNRNAVAPKELPRWFSTVLFAPEDLALVRGDPAGRRRFLDEAVVALNPAASALLQDYERVVRQRTALLKSARGVGSVASIESTLGLWDEQLIQLGTRIIEARRAIVYRLRNPLQASYELLVASDHQPSILVQESIASQERSEVVSRETSGHEHSHKTDVRTHPSHENDDVSRETIYSEFRQALQTVRSKEIDRGMTLVGPHRDDLLLSLNGLPVKGYASHGESWSFVLALKLALAEVIRADAPSGDPVLLLDDVFAELDQDRRSRLMAAVGDFEQVIVTAAVEADIPDSVSWNRMEIREGALLGEETLP